MRINRTNPEQPAAQPVQSHAPLKAQTEVNGFELPEQEIPKENQKEPPKAAKPPKPKKEKPAKSPAAGRWRRSRTTRRTSSPAAISRLAA